MLLYGPNILAEGLYCLSFRLIARDLWTPKTNSAHALLDSLVG